MATNYPYVNSENLGTFKDCLEAWVLEQLKNYDLSAYETVEAAQKAHDELVQQLEAEIAKKQDILSAGTGIVITDNVVSCTLDTSLYKIVDELPAEGEDGKIYCIKDPESTDEKNIYDEWYWTGEEWEMMGKYIPTVDLTTYQTKEEAAADKSELEAEIKAEETARENKDTELEEAISALEKNVSDNYETKEDANEAHAKLQESLESEGTARSEADNELSKRLDELAEKMNELTGDTVKWVTSEEGFLIALVDSEDSLLLGITKDAKLYIPAGILDGITDTEKSLRDVLGDYATKSELPTKTSQLTNDSGYITSSALGDYAKTSDIPTNVSQLNNDSGYITESQADGKYLTDDDKVTLTPYTEDEIKALFD